MMAAESRRSLHLDLPRTCTDALSDLMLDELLSLSTSGGSQGKAAVPVTSTSTPTPTQFLFPRSVTEEQEAYASGFARALEEIYRSEGRPNLQMSAVSSTVGRLPTYDDVCRITIPAAEIFQNYSNKLDAFGCYTSYSTGTCSSTIWSTSMPTPPTPSLLTVNVGGQTVLPSNELVGDSAADMSSFINSTSNSSSILATSQSTIASCSSTSSSAALSSPEAMASLMRQPERLNMDEQDELKLERKRAKNRVAAARCQMRKVERITRLQEKVERLRQYNTTLASTVADLTTQVSSLRKQILLHTERGCRMMIPEFT